MEIRLIRKRQSINNISNKYNLGSEDQGTKISNSLMHITFGSEDQGNRIKNPLQ